MSFHWELLSPSQWPACFPLPTKVERLRTNARFPVACWTTLWQNATRSLKIREVTKNSHVISMSFPAQFYWRWCYSWNFYYSDVSHVKVWLQNCKQWKVLLNGQRKQLKSISSMKHFVSDMPRLPKNYFAFQLFSILSQSEYLKQNYFYINSFYLMSYHFSRSNIYIFFSI